MKKLLLFLLTGIWGIYGYSQENPCQSFIKSLEEYSNYGKYVIVKGDSVKEEYLIYSHYKCSPELMMVDGKLDSARFKKLCNVTESIHMIIQENEVTEVYLNCISPKGETQFARKTKVISTKEGFSSMTQEQARRNENAYEIKKIHFVNKKKPKLIVETSNYNGKKSKTTKETIRDQDQVKEFVEDMNLVYGFLINFIVDAL